MKLRTRLNLVLTGVTAVFLAVLVADEIRDARSSVSEEIEAANRVAGQVLGGLILTYASSGGTQSVADILRQLGHVRANDVTLRDASGRLVYHSPPPIYKAGREAPAWFTHLLAPAPARQTFTLGDGAQVVIEAQPSRAILDAWDDLARLNDLALPPTLIVGELDAKFRAIGQEMAARVAGARLCCVSGAGHAVHLERPDVFAGLVAGAV